MLTSIWPRRSCPAPPFTPISLFTSNYFVKVMLPTPSTSHVNTDCIYEPAEDSYLLLDTLSSKAETQFLTQRFAAHHPTTGPPAASASPLILEVGTGSGVVLAFVTAHAHAILGRADVVALGTDVNGFACKATEQTVAQACRTSQVVKREDDDSPGSGSGFHLATLSADLASPLRNGLVDLLIFNPPYVPSPAVPEPQHLKLGTPQIADGIKRTSRKFEDSSHLLRLSYDGGVDGIEVTNRLLEQLPNVLSVARGTAYILLCAQNKPKEVMQRIRRWGDGWLVAVVGHSGKKAGWEKLQIIRVWHS